ncbi:hypothetical protein NK718_09675 [Alsobacter sp. SYSU M60028]|uniref:DUF4198 domain-containing protein n=1 Tax=Alsobacter ponti TaxID=2962936 RepID=A0ABT1LBB8_9HYPH|nr:hypothetical protein [Alsobacter ponti]MCP8938782.1 hypothetical protein [Alsobacter ponti]
MPGLLRMAAVATLVAAMPAQGHDFWINNGGYTDRTTGVHCCGPNDCLAVAPARIVVVKDGYLLDGNEFVPFSDAYVSEDHDYWRCRKADGSRRCFFAPVMTF